jgi:hypothetical protein
MPSGTMRSRTFSTFCVPCSRSATLNPTLIQVSAGGGSLELREHRLGTAEKIKVSKTPSWCVAGVWSIWFLRSVSCVWFDERE